MKAVTTVLLWLCIIHTSLGQEPSQAKIGPILAPDKFDQWGDLPLVDEEARLDKIANQAKEWSMSMIYLVIHAGQKACVGEAKARGLRAKNYLMKKDIAPERIVWIDAGWRKELSVEVWLWPPELGRPKSSTELNLKAGQVQIERNCKIKYRGTARS
jgi:hypothetical protein